MDKLREILRKNPRSSANFRLYVCLMGRGRRSDRMQFATPKLKEIVNSRSCPHGTFGGRNSVLRSDVLWSIVNLTVFQLLHTRSVVLLDTNRLRYVHVEIAQYMVDALYLLAALDERYEFRFGATQHNTYLLLDC